MNLVFFYTLNALWEVWSAWCCHYLFFLPADYWIVISVLLKEGKSKLKWLSLSAVGNFERYSPSISLVLVLSGRWFLRKKNIYGLSLRKTKQKHWEDKHTKQVFLDKAVCTIRWIKGGMQLHSYWLGGRKTPTVYFICTEVIEVSYACSLKVAQEHSLERWGKRQPYSTEIFSNPWKESWKWMWEMTTSL